MKQVLMKKLIALVFIISLFSNTVSAGEIGSTYGPNRVEFLELCKNVEQEIKNNNGLNSSCFIYFMGMRDGYLSSEYEALHRAAMYYWYKGDIPPGGELEFKYVLKVSDATDNPAYRALDSHTVRCMRKDDPRMLLNDFIKYLKTIKRLNGATKLFNEFAVKKYAGKC